MSGKTAVIVLIALYFVIKWAVRNGIKEAYKSITGEETFEDKQFDICSGSDETDTADTLSRS